MDIEARDRLVSNVTTITETGEWTLDKDLLKDIKRTCKLDAIYIETAYEVIMSQLKKKHPIQIRYSCMQLCEELFQRSHHFRQFLMNDFPIVIELSVGIKNTTLPPPAPVAQKLRRFAIALIKDWYNHYGEQLRPLSIGYDYLEHNGFLQGDQSLQSIHQSDRLSANKQERLKVIQERRFGQIKEDMDGHLDLVQDTLKNMESCFEILVPKNDDVKDHSGLDFDAMLNGTWNGMPSTSNDEDYNESLRSHGLASNRYSITVTIPSNPLEEQVHESAENSIIYEQLREAYKVLETKQIKQVNAWINSLIRMDHVDKVQKDRLIKQLIDTKNKVDESIRKVKLLGIELPPNRRPSQLKDDEESDDDMDAMFEEIELPDLATLDTVDIDESDITKVRNAALPPRQRLFPLAFEPQMVDDVTYAGAQVDQPLPTSEEYITSPKEKGKGKQTVDREELLKKAPVVEWGDDLFYWNGDNVQFNQSGLEFSHRFLGTGEGTNEIPDHLLEDLRKRKVFYKSHSHGNLKACRHPLNSGGLCPRRDLVTCPFHGKIIPRDELGSPVVDTSFEEPAFPTFSAAASSSAAAQKKKASLWQEIEGDVMQQLGKDRIEPKRKRGRQPFKKKSALIDIKKPSDTPFSRLKRKVESKESQRMVEEAWVYQEDIKNRDRKASLWR
ncbi:hypothetical protein DM01DRAFT_1336966, partial [Hesseltinella vesiculosa]